MQPKRNLERHSNSRVGLWYNHPSNRKIAVYLRTAAEEKHYLETHHHHFIDLNSPGSLYVLPNAQPVLQAKGAHNDGKPAYGAGPHAGRDPRSRSNQESKQIYVLAWRSDQ